MALIGAFAISLCAFFAVSPSRTTYETPFASKLVSIYQKYDESALSSRLLLSNFNCKKTYGATDYALDKENSFAVLQYENEADAKAAMKKIESDGIAVEFDSKARLEASEKGSVFPAGSNALGTHSYISKFKMSKDDVIVAVIDTGVMYDHELMENRFVSRGYDFSDDGRNNAYYDTRMSDNVYAHGTFVCGIIADNTPDNVKLLPYKVVPFGGSDASNSAIVAAIYDAVIRGASVINISMSTSSGSNAFKYAVEAALNNNVCICASAGNDAKEIKYRYPASTPGVITVSALESDMQSFASFSNFGSVVDFCAPGRSIVSACPYKSGGSKFMTNSGTSFSAPYITAVCANIKSINNSFTKNEVYDIICDFSTDLGTEGYDIYYGNGLPNLADMNYTDSQSYSFKIPEGRLDILSNTDDFTEKTQPWRLFADKMLGVYIGANVDEIGAYSFYNMKKAFFYMSSIYKSIGDFAFYSCNNLTEMKFDEEISNIGREAFGDISEDFSISGYRNTAAEFYSQRENIEFNVLGCKHNFLAEVYEPTEEESGYTFYTCTVCGESHIGDYIQPPEYYEGECGMGVYWRFTTKEKTLEISGSGYMTSYSSPSEVPWSAFMSKIKSATVGEDIIYISDYLLCDANNCDSLKILSKTATFSDKIIYFSGSACDIDIYAYDDSSAKDYFTENSIEYISLGCAHSRQIDFYEEQPSCCFDTYGVYTCSDCGNIYREFISNDNKGHYFSGSVTTLGADAIIGCEVYVDSKLSAITNAKGQYVVNPILCGEHSVEIRKRGEVLDSFNINIDKTNLRCKSNLCYGDYDNNGVINAKDYALALKNGYDDADIIDYGKTKPNGFSSESYSVQELPFALQITNLPNDDTEGYRDFLAVIENNSEYDIKESGFIYGKNMSDDMLFLDKVGQANGEGYVVKVKSASNNDAYEKVLKYGSSTGTGTLSARFYIIYTNGVEDFTYYSEVTSYTYPD